MHSGEALGMEGEDNVHRCLRVCRIKPFVDLTVRMTERYFVFHAGA